MVVRKKVKTKVKKPVRRNKRKKAPEILQQDKSVQSILEAEDERIFAALDEEFDPELVSEDIVSINDDPLDWDPNHYSQVK